MDVKTLKSIIADLPDNMRVGGCGHYGEFLECWGVEVYEMLKHTQHPTEKILKIEIQEMGEEPE